jgi:DnaJ-class molecular chaperone
MKSLAIALGICALIISGNASAAQTCKAKAIQESSPVKSSTHMKTCPDCNGEGVVDKDTDDERQFPTCGGLGFIPDDDEDHEEVIKTSCDLPHSVGGKP